MTWMTWMIWMTFPFSNQNQGVDQGMQSQLQSNHIRGDRGSPSHSDNLPAYSKTCKSELGSTHFRCAGRCTCLRIGNFREQSTNRRFQRVGQTLGWTGVTSFLDFFFGVAFQSVMTKRKSRGLHLRDSKGFDWSF